MEMQEEEWSCDACFTKNAIAADFCHVCYYPQPQRDRNTPQEAVPLRQAEIGEGYHTPSKSSPSVPTSNSPDQKELKKDGEILTFSSLLDDRDRKRDGELVRPTINSPTTSRSISSRPIQIDGTVDFVYGICLKPFLPGQDTVAEKNARKLVELLQLKLGRQCVSLITGVTNDGPPGAYIKVGCTFQDYERLAEEQKLEIRVKDEIAAKTGQHYQAFSRRAKSMGLYWHPALSDDASLDLDLDCARGNPSRSCACDLFLPYHKTEIVRKVISEALDTFMGEKIEGFGVKAAIGKGVIREIYPLHLDKRSRDEFAQNFIYWGTVFRTPWVMTARSRKFIEYWRGYFGEKMGMYMGFLHFYTTALLFLVVPGTVLAVLHYLHGADNYGVPIYCMMIALWSVIWLQLWARKQSVLAYNWGMEHYREEEKEIPEYIRKSIDNKWTYGFYEKGRWVDMEDYARGKLQEEQTNRIPSDYSIVQLIPKHKPASEGVARKVLRFLFAQTALLTMVTCSLFATLGLLLFRVIVQQANEVFWGGVAGGMLTGVCIVILEQIYFRIAVLLNDLDNHRTAKEYEDSLVYKTFFFGFVNTYCSLFYIAFYKGHSTLFGHSDYCRDAEGKLSPDCMTELSTQLTAVYFTRLFLGTTIEVAVPWLKLRWNNYIARRTAALRGVRGNERLLQANRPKDIVQIEGEMADYSSAKVNGAFYDYYELAIQFGFVVLFAPAFPLAPLLALLTNIVEVATDGYKTLEVMKRPAYQGAVNIGPWWNVFNFLCVASVITNSLMIGFTSSQLDRWLTNPTTTNKWIFVVVLEHGVLAILYLVAHWIPNEPGWVQDKIAKSNKIMEIEDEYTSSVKQWRAEKENHTSSTHHLNKYQYDASEDEKEVSRSSFGDEPGAPPGLAINISYSQYAMGSSGATHEQRDSQRESVSSSPGRPYHPYGAPTYGSQQFSQSDRVF